MTNNDDKKSWEEAMRTVTPLDSEPAPIVESSPIAEPAPIAMPPLAKKDSHHKFSFHKEQQREKAPPKKNLAKSIHSILPLVADDVAMLSRSQRLAIKRENIHYDKTIDLHGCRLMNAYHRVKQTIQQRGKNERWLCFITGQGKKGGAEEGFQGSGKILNEFPHWMNRGELRPHIITFGHQGRGAYYVYVRKR